MAKKITIGINGTVFKNPVTGVAKRLIYLILATKKKYPFTHFVIFSPYPFFVKELRGIPQVIKKSILGEWWWVHFTLPALLKKNQVTIFDSIWGGGIPFIPASKRDYTIVVTYHDFIPLDKLSEKNSFLASLIIRFLKKRILKNLVAADRVVLVAPDVLRKLNFYFKNRRAKSSEAQTLNTINKKIVISPNGINLINSLNKKPPKQQTKRVNTRGIKIKGKVVSNYFLYVGGFNSRKNVPMLLAAYKKYLLSAPKSTNLILVGQENRFFQKEIYPQIKNNHNIISVGYVEEEALMAFYQHAKALFYPSLKEGFGMPPLEALANNCPAVVDKNLPLNDWNLAGIHPVDMKSPLGITAFMLGERKINQPKKKELLEFKWDKIAERYYREVYQFLAHKK